MNNVRKSVAEALVNLETSQGYSNISLDALLRKNNFTSSDKALASRLFYGVIERKITLDYYIGKLSSKPVKKLTPLVLNCIRLGIYQLEFMDKIPESAAVNESVNIIKCSKERYAAGFVNAILRSFIREKIALPQDNSSYALSVRYSCPAWFIEELSTYIGKDLAFKFLKNSLIPPPVYIRTNNTVTDGDSLLNTFLASNITANKKSSECIELSFVNSPQNLKEFIDGHFHIQDISSQICVSALDPKPNDRLLDICSAPGGKSCTAAEIMMNRGEVVSCDIHEHRVNLIKTNADRLKLNIIKPTLNDATQFNSELGYFDKILCDVPCSGFGVIRRKPEIKYKPQSDLTNLPELQYNILDMSSRYLKCQGRIVYSTCTLRREENEDIIIRFLNEHPDFTVEKTFSQYFFDYGHRLMPENCGGDGFFFAVLKRK